LHPHVLFGNREMLTFFFCCCNPSQVASCRAAGLHEGVRQGPPGAARSSRRADGRTRSPRRRFRRHDVHPRTAPRDVHVRPGLVPTNGLLPRDRRAHRAALGPTAGRRNPLRRPRKLYFPPSSLSHSFVSILGGGGWFACVRV